MVILGVNIGGCIELRQEVNEVTIYDKYTGRPDGVEKMYSEIYILKYGNVEIVVKEDITYDGLYYSRSEGSKFIEELEKHFAKFNLEVHSDYGSYYFEDGDVYVGKQIWDGHTIKQVTKLYNESLNNFLQAGFNKEDIRFHISQD